MTFKSTILKQNSSLKHCGGCCSIPSGYFNKNRLMNRNPPGGCVCAAYHSPNDTRRY
ncbi:MAG: hypothetical protein IPJ74_19640 [Saprospiraceae bacterium]|nr:hypothetical protein [Saprospiraceae bacterium]